MDRYVVVTGASSGIGFATAIKFAGLGKNIILIARRKERLNQLKEQLLQINKTLDIVVCPWDLSKIEKIPELFSKISNFDIEVWINNAGFGIRSEFKNQDYDRTEQMLKLNVEALTLLSLEYVKKFSDFKGTQLINVASSVGYVLIPNVITYAATKFYVASFTEGLAQELVKTGSPMKAKVIAPNATLSEFSQVATMGRNNQSKNLPERYHTSEEMAEFIVRLYKGEDVVGYIDSATDFSFKTTGPRFKSKF